MSLLAQFFLNGEISFNIRAHKRMGHNLLDCNIFEFLEEIQPEFQDLPIMAQKLTFLKNCRLPSTRILPQGLGTKGFITRRINGGTSREDYTPTNKRLSLIEEEVIVKNILKLDAQGLSPSISLVKEMADTICKARGAQPVGVNWPNTFIKRTPRLQVKLGRAYECQRKLCEDPQVIKGWFELVKNTINKYGIIPEDIYNFDEAGFQMG
jgi:hypothetical protein